ncbi:hypothetical protein [Allorhizocola rhizosphaerae]|uniref:hypothetical protein n=1 Tax=Allorhizocola rhizosphaerae TaxID=1872709 RepID=UPI0013C2E8BC|nr:hypothetical protein [Allorhizocola rhizosphaerae]
MPSDIARLRAQIARQRYALSQLDVVEAAEHLVRSHHRQLLDDELAELHKELVRAQRTLDLARDGNDLNFIVVAEEDTCRVQRQVTLLQRQSREHDVAAAKVRSAYLAQRQQLVELVNQLQHLLVRTIRRAP